ncbi:MAG: ABC transporter ATP-binding protein [Bacteroidota bacterium]
MPILQINNLSKSFDGRQTYALQDATFNLDQGKICAIVGKSGSGKTTLLRLIAGLERPNSGTIIINGQIMSDDKKIVPPQRRNVGMVFQDYALFPHLTVAQNIGFSLKKKDTAKVKSLLTIIDLEGFDDRYPHELSGGEQQRVAIARTLAYDPQLLLLDEPFGNLDADLKAHIRSEVHRIVKAINVTVLFITHDIQDAMAIADEVIFLKDGQILEKGELPDLYQQATTPEVQTLFANLRHSANEVLTALQS